MFDLCSRLVLFPIFFTRLTVNVATIGRDHYCTVSVSHNRFERLLFQRISRHHCTLMKSLEDGKFTIVNNSLNGTFVNAESELINFARCSIAHGTVVAHCSTTSEEGFTLFDHPLLIFLPPFLIPDPPKRSTLPHLQSV